MSIRSSRSIVSFKVCVSLLIFCLVDLSIVVSGVLKSPTRDLLYSTPLTLQQATVTLHSTVPNPYTLLSLLPPRTRIYTCLDLKDAFFCTCLAPASQPIFAFEWEDRIRGNKQHITWTRLPQGFKSAPTIFGEALASDLEPFQPER